MIKCIFPAAESGNCISPPDVNKIESNIGKLLMDELKCNTEVIFCNSREVPSFSKTHSKSNYVVWESYGDSDNPNATLVMHLYDSSISHMDIIASAVKDCVEKRLGGQCCDITRTAGFKLIK